MQLRSFPTHGNVTGWQAPTHFLHGCTQRFVSAIRQAPGCAWTTLAGLELSPQARDTFGRGRNEHAGFALPHDVIFAEDPFPIVMRFGAPEAAELTTLEVDDAEMLRGLHGALSGARDSEAALDFAEQLEEAGVLTASSAPAIDWQRPGIYRLQHASLLFVGQSATVLTDPVFTDDWMWAGALPQIDAIVISHSHSDHFSLPSLMQFPRDTLIVVPRVDRASMLSEDMGTLLRHAGFTNVRAEPWYSRVEIGDVEIGIYPFYGEQPWVNFAAPDSALRNAGNTYLIDCEGTTTWILIDAGREHGQSMVDVARRVHDEHGDLDIVMSNLRVFPWHPGQIDGSGRYLFCYPLERLEDPGSWPDGVNITLGPHGVSALLREVGARHFFPYAHWWHQPGSGPHIIDGSYAESDMVALIAEDRPPAAQLRAWGVGDRIQVDRNELIVNAFV